MSLPVGSWNISTDGLGSGTLSIDSVDSSGNVSGSITVPAGGAIVGYFDAGAQTVSLSNVTNPTQAFIVFSANLFQVVSGSAKTHTTGDYVLAGAYESYPPGSPVSTGRWVASVSQKIKEKDKEEKEKEQSKEAKDSKDAKEHVHDKVHPDVLPQVAANPATQVQQLAARLNAVEQRLATGQSFIGAQERPSVGDQTIGNSGPST
jgi:hypothetical protein